MGEFAASIKRSKAKSVSASGGLRPPDTPTRDSVPGPRWGVRPQTPVIGSRSARSPCPLFQILNTPLDYITVIKHQPKIPQYATNKISSLINFKISISYLNTQIYTVDHKKVVPF